MALNSRFAVAVHVMVDLAFCEKHQVRSSKEMALSVNTNPVVIRRIFSELHSAGLILTVAGTKGGARLAKPPRSISLWEIFGAVQESDVFFHNPNEPNPKCEISCTMQKVLEPVFAAAERALRAELSAQRLDLLVNRCRRYSSR